MERPVKSQSPSWKPPCEVQMERCAALKGYAGKLRAAIYCAHDILHRQSLRPDGFLSQNEQDVDAILAQALDVKAP
jgi:hypothetical protein